MITENTFLENKDTIQTKAPVRISFGTCGDSNYYMDFLGWGNGINATINLYSYCEIHRLQENKIVLRSLETGKTLEYQSPSDIEFGSRELNLMKAVVKHYSDAITEGFEIITYTDAPLESGLGGSAAHAVSMIDAMNKFTNKTMTRGQVALLAYHLEREVLGIEGGYQDQWASSYGGVNYMKFQNGSVVPTQLKLTGNELEYLENNILLFFVPRQKQGSALHAEQREKAKESVAMLRMKRENIEKLKSKLEGRMFNELGDIFHFDWKIKKLTAPDITNSRIDEIYNAAMNAGAQGGRFIGAGAGGSAIFFCPNKTEEVTRELEKMGVKRIRYKFERTHKNKNFRHEIKDRIDEHHSMVKSTLNDEVLMERVNEITNKIVECYRNDGKLIVFGNGGSAADAQHIVGELVNYFKIRDRPMINALALTVNTTVLTAIANDSSFDEVFSRQIESLVDSRDVVLGISTSGKAVNVLKAFQKAKERGAFVVYFTGKDGGMISQFCEKNGIVDVSVKVPHPKTDRIQEMHITLGHIICELVENELYGQ